MNRDADELLELARETLEDARVLFEKARYPGTVERTYFAILHAASAMLSHQGTAPDTHYGVKIKFGEVFAKSGKVERRFGKTLSDAYDLRMDAEYTPEARSAITRDVAQEQLEKASGFIKMAAEFLRQAGGERESGENP